MNSDRIKEIQMENKITITATSKGATIVLNYEGKTYTQKCIPTISGARYEGCSFEDEENLPSELVEELTGFTAYNLMNVLAMV